VPARPADGFPDFRRHHDGTVRLPERTGGPGRLLVWLVADGLDPAALPIAAALVVRLDTDARSRAEARRIKARRASEARWERARAA
jgi:hypothetical protein